jgi:hypothetical protein
LSRRSPADGDLPRLDGLDLRQVDRPHAAPQLGADLVRRDRLGHAELRQQAATPVSATWTEALVLLGQNEPERLRAALLATINEIRVLTAADKTRMAAVQVYFAGGAVRSYLITHRPYAKTQWNWAVRSFADARLTKLDLDLRNREHAAALEKELSGIDTLSGHPN